MRTFDNLKLRYAHPCIGATCIGDSTNLSTLMDAKDSNILHYMNL